MALIRYRLVSSRPGTKQKVDRFVYSQMCDALPAVTTESDLGEHCPVILHAQSSAEESVIALSTC
eukprot:3392591-Pleurochrysis_carterae.AAC.5